MTIKCLILTFAVITILVLPANAIDMDFSLANGINNLDNHYEEYDLSKALNLPDTFSGLSDPSFSDKDDNDIEDASVVNANNSDEPKQRPKRWPKIFDFSLFVKKFERVYSGPLETLKRKAIYMARTVKIFFRNILWSKGKSLYFLRVGPYADFSEQELDKLYSMPDQHDYIIEDDDSSEKTSVVPETQLKLQLEQIIETHSPGSRVIAEAIQQRLVAEDKQVRHKRENENFTPSPISHRNTKSQDLPEEFIEVEPKLMLSPKMAFDVRATEENPDYEMPMVMSQSDVAKKPQAPANEIGFKDLVDAYKNVRKVKFVSRNVNELLNQLNKPAPKIDNNNDDYHHVENDFQGLDDYDDKMFHDWRLTQCLPAIKRQNNCGSCWAFVGMAKLEFEHCRQTGQLVTFSEQYYVDCSLIFDADRYKLNGCNGGVVPNMNFMINIYGVELSRVYPYKAEEGYCPYPPKTPEHKMGRLKPKIVKKRVHSDESSFQHIDEYLDNGPVMVDIHTPSDMSDYGGGVHSGESCNPKRAHSMLVIGDGVEDGIQYWLFRNSHGPVWGEGGHFKLAKSAPSKCHFRIIYWEVEFPQQQRLQIRPTKKRKSP